MRTLLAFLFVFLFFSTVAQAQTLHITGTPQYGATGTHYGSGFPYESYGGLPSGSDLVASVFQDDCFFAYRYQLSTDSLEFHFLNYPTEAYSYFPELGTDNSMEILIEVDDFVVQVYPGCLGDVGDQGRTLIYTGNPGSSTAIWLWWVDLDNAMQGGTWHSIDKSKAKASGQHNWAYGAEGLIEATNHTDGRTLSIIINNQADIVQAGKRYGISSTTTRARLIGAKCYSLVSFDSIQDANGIVELSAGARVSAKISYWLDYVLNEGDPGWPDVVWLNN